MQYTSYDDVDNRLNVVVGSDEDTYDCDEIYRLKTVDYNDGPTVEYSYDEVDSFTSVDNDGTVTSFTTNSLHQYDTLSYDDNGNLTFDGTNTYVYDCENKLIEVKTGATTVATYNYDFASRRIEKVIDSNATEFVYDGDQVIAEYEDIGSGNVLVRKFIYGPGIDEPIMMIVVDGTETKYYYHFDGLGSVVALSNSKPSQNLHGGWLFCG